MTRIRIALSVALLVAFVALAGLGTDAPTATAEILTDAVVVAQSDVSPSTADAENDYAELLPPLAVPQSHWRCNDVSFGTAIQCACNDGGLGTGGPDCLATLNGFRVSTQGSGDSCDAFAECDDGTDFSCSGGSTCQARIDTATGDGWVDCDGNRTNFTC